MTGWKLRQAVAGLLAVAALASSCASRSGTPGRVVLIVVDTLRRDHLSIYGAEQPTPHIDALAERGQVFSNVVASFHQTSMSMASLFTGRTPSIEAADAAEPLPWNGATWCGMRRFGRDGSLCLPESLPTLAEGLRDAGYWTIGIASNEFLYEPSGFSRGFDDWVEVGEKPREHDGRMTQRPPSWLVQRSSARVHEAAVAALDRRRDDRFFLYVHYMDVHDYARGGSVYEAGVRLVDDAIGRLLGALAARDLLEGAVVVLTSDHGERLGERHPVEGTPSHLGNPSFQEVLEIPLIVAPAIEDDPSRFLRTQDLFALIREIAGLSVAPVVDLEADELFVGEIAYRTYRKGRWKTAVRREDGLQLLFDLENDPGESRNVATDHPEVAEAQRRRIEELSRRLGTTSTVPDVLSPDDRERLRALGYLEETP